MSTDGLTPEALKQQHANTIAKGDTFEPQGISRRAALNYLQTDEGAMYWWRVAEAAAPNTHSSAIDDRAVNQLQSGRALPRMETLGTHEALIKFVAEGSSPSAHSPYWARESEADAAIAKGKNISEHFGLPVGSEAPRYGMYRITPTVPTQVFINTVAPTSELGGLVIKPGGAEQALVPNRQLFNAPVYVRSIDNVPSLASEVGRGGLSSGVIRGAGALGAVAIAWDATATASRTADLLHQGNPTGARSQVEHFGAHTVAGLGLAAGGAELGSFGGPVGTILGGAIGYGIGAVAGDKLADAYDRYKIYHQDDPQGITWHYDPDLPQQGWTRDLRPLPGAPCGEHFTADPRLADRLTWQANNTAVELALAHAATPRDPWTQPAAADDTPSKRAAPWTRDAQTRRWSRQVTDRVLEHGLTATHVETASPPRAARLDTAAQQTIVANLARSPRGIAEQYQAIHAQRGWVRHGPLPEAVIDALKTPAHALEASDGHTYTRDTAGQWTTPGTLWGSNPAHGHVRAELDATDRRVTAREAAPPATPLQAAPASAPMHAHLQSSRPADPAHARNDPRHPDNPGQALYNELHRRIPDASDNRLLQFTAACHTNGITANNLTTIHLDEAGAQIGFFGSSFLSTPSVVDLRTPSPPPEQSILHIQQFDQQQAQMMSEIRAQNVLLNAQAPQGPMR